MSAEENKAIARKFYEEWNTGNLESIYALVTDDLVDHNPVPGQVPGKAGLRQALGVFKTAFPNLQVTLEHVVAEGDRAVYHGTARGTHQGNLLGIPPTGKLVEFTFTDIYRIANGKIAEIWHIEDLPTVMQQIGVVPAPTQAR